MPCCIGDSGWMSSTFFIAKLLGSNESYPSRPRSVSDGLQKHLLLPEQAFRDDTGLAAFPKQFVRFDDLRRLLGVLQAHDVIQPRLLPHRVHVNLPAVEAAHEVVSLSE